MATLSLLVSLVVFLEAVFMLQRMRFSSLTTSTNRTHLQVPKANAGKGASLAFADKKKPNRCWYNMWLGLRLSLQTL